MTIKDFGSHKFFQTAEYVCLLREKCDGLLSASRTVAEENGGLFLWDLIKITVKIRNIIT